MLHYFSPDKPWKPFSTTDLVRITERMRWPMLPFYRMVWLDYASRVRGFENYCAERPYLPLEIMCMANTVLLFEKRLREASESIT
ncbi:MAG: hypothetical protein K1X67_17200 [Fimbriimonadaceae bacterium]|nr:hypothetical protein [Fimbriimonadaceae bacterium]